MKKRSCGYCPCDVCLLDCKACNPKGRITHLFRDRILLVGAVCLVVIFLLDFFRINLTNNITVTVVIGTGLVVIMYIQKAVKKIEKPNI